MTRLAVALCVFLIGGIGTYFYMGCNAQTPLLMSRHRIDTDHKPFLFPVEHARSVSAFRVDWPPSEPMSRRRTAALLTGELVVMVGERNNKPHMNVRIELIRADSESDRQRWNRKLKFPEYDWMSRVRVWDRKQQWLWPNLSFLLRAHGVERQQRYGGVDPGKGIDNDFAAIVVKSRGGGEEEQLITAEWNSPPVGFVDRRSIVHRAISNDILFEIPSSKRTGKIGVWLIYADFLNFKPPESWPEQPEFDGGILSYFSIGWNIDNLGEIEIVEMENQIPPESTGIDWSEWLDSNQNAGITKR